MNFKLRYCLRAIQILCSCCPSCPSFRVPMLNIYKNSKIFLYYLGVSIGVAVMAALIFAIWVGLCLAFGYPFDTYWFHTQDGKEDGYSKWAILFLIGWACIVVLIVTVVILALIVLIIVFYIVKPCLASTKRAYIQAKEEDEQLFYSSFEQFTIITNSSLLSTKIDNKMLSKIIFEYLALEKEKELIIVNVV